MASVAEIAAQLRADLQLLDAGTKEAAALLDRAGFQLGELHRLALPMTNRTLALTRARENIAAAAAAAEEVLEHLDASFKMQGIIQAGPRANPEAFFAALQRLEAAIDFLQAHRSMASAEDALRHTAALRDSGLAACAQEFGALLQRHSSVPPPALARLRAAAVADGASSSLAAADSAASAGPPLELVPDAVLPKLQALAAAMLRGGAGSSQGCVRAYVASRRGAMQAALEGSLTGLSGSSKEELARQSWQHLESRIPGWVAALRLFVRLAQEEALLCAAVFPAAERAAVLSQVAASGSASILECAEAVLAVRRVPDKMFGLLEMYNAVEAALAPLRAALAAGVSRLERGSAALAHEQPAIVAQLGQLRTRLGAEVRACFVELQDSLPREAAKGLPVDGTVHPLCATTVALLKRLLAYESALPVLMGDGMPAARGAGGLAEEARLLDRMAAAVARVFDTLLAVLESKSRLAYKSRALAALHQMNNYRHVAHAVETSRELRAAGEGWLEQHKDRVERYQQQYMEEGWGALLALLRQDAQQPVPPNLAADKAARQAIKDKWTALNKALADVQVQQSWAVPDTALRFALKDSLSDALLPLYEGFHKKYSTAAYTDTHSKYERFTPAALAALVSDLFEQEGGAASSARSVSSGSSFTKRLSTRRISGTP